MPIEKIICQNSQLASGPCLQSITFLIWKAARLEGSFWIVIAVYWLTNSALWKFLSGNRMVTPAKWDQSFYFSRFLSVFVCVSMLPIKFKKNNRNNFF
tara:strand:- start:508 stop:801 length:294 start_codon:yes stop_codon:yes gene_type:complete